jgi:NTP pyrophosphatase (non-canonical NTP hydrolase)
MTNIDDFAEWTTTKWYQSHDGVTEKDLSIMTLGLAGESGEVVEIIKKKLRDGQFDIDHFKSEMGDVIYYWGRLCKAMNVLPSEILEGNIAKLELPRSKMTKSQLTQAVSDSLHTILMDTKVDPRELSEVIINMVLNSGVKK